MLSLPVGLERTSHWAFLWAAELLTSACGTPSGGRHCSRTSCSNGTSLPSGSWSKFLRRSRGERKTQGLPAHAGTGQPAKAWGVRALAQHQERSVTAQLEQNMSWEEGAEAASFPGWIQDSTRCSRSMPFLLHALASLNPLLSFPFGPKPQLNHCFFNSPISFPLWTPHQDFLLKGHNSSAPMSSPRQVLKFQSYGGLLLGSALVSPG